MKIKIMFRNYQMLGHETLGRVQHSIYMGQTVTANLIPQQRNHEKNRNQMERLRFILIVAVVRGVMQYMMTHCLAHTTSALITVDSWPLTSLMDRHMDNRWIIFDPLEMFDKCR